MVFATPSEIPRLNAYLLTDLSSDELGSFKKAFEYGTFAPFCTMLELVIKKAPENYINQPHSFIRRKENEAGRTDPFILIDEQVVRQGAVWYVDDFAKDFEAGDVEPIAESTAVLWEILVQTEYLAIAWANYDVGNLHIHEDLSFCGVESPVRKNFVQPTVHRCGRLDLERERHTRSNLFTAEPGEFEESTDEEVLKNILPRPDVAYRLKKDIARNLGVKNGWVGGQKPRELELPDGTMRGFSEGSITLFLRYDPDFPWPRYEWPEESS